MKDTVMDIIERIGSERNISADVLVEAIEAAMVSASKKMLGANVNVSRAEMDRQSGEFRVFASKYVAEIVEDEATQMTLEEAREIKPDADFGDEIEFDITPPDFGRIAAQSAKQVVTQRIREAEREMVYDRFKNRVGDVLNGTVLRFERGNLLVDLGLTEALLPNREQAFGERLRIGDRVKFYIMDVQRSAREAQVILSRRHPMLLAKLFEQAVPEIGDGLVSVKAVAREAGRRSKIAVASADSNVDPVGACVGMKGSRVQTVVQELRGERIDIVEYSDDKRRFVANSLKPAEIRSTELSPDGQSAMLVVKDDQLSQAIGKNGLNVRLASELTGVSIDVISETELVQNEQQAKETLLAIPGVGEQLADTLMEAGFFSLEDIIESGAEALQEVEGIGPAKAEKILEGAKTLYDRILAEEPQGEEQPIAEDVEVEISEEPLEVEAGNIQEKDI